MTIMTEGLIGRDRECASINAHLDAGRGVLLIGDPGVGKSFLARRLATVRAGQVEMISGTIPARAIAFGAVAQLLGPIAAEATEAVVMQQIVDRLERFVDDGGLVVVDDIDLLDDASRAVVSLLSGRVALLATARSDESTDPFVVGLWKDQRLQRIDIGPVDRDASDTIVEMSVGGAIDDALALELWRRAAGNPLLIRELCSAGIGSGAIEHSSDASCWTLVGELRGGRRIVDLIRSRLDELDDDLAAGLLAVVLLDPLALDLADRMCRSASLDELARRRLIVETTFGDQVAFRPAHPIVTEAVLASASPGRLDRLADDIAAAEASSLSPGDARKVSTALLLAGRDPGPATATSGATAALAAFDYAQAEQLARVATSGDGALASADRFTARLLLGRALAGLGRIEEATTELERATALATDRPQRTEAVQALAELLMFPAARPHEAIDRLTQLLDDIGGDGDTSSIRLQLALAYGVVDELRTADRLASELVNDPLLPPPALLPAMMVHTLARSISGQVDGLDAALDRGDELAHEFQTSQPLARDQLALNRVLTAHARADVSTSARLVAAARDGDDFDDRMQGPWFYIDLPALVLRGDLAAAVADSERSITLHRLSDPVGTLPMALALGGVVHAMSGDVATARALLDEAVGVGAEHQIRCRVWLAFAESWMQALDGDLTGAASTAAEAGRVAIDAWHSVWGAITAHAAVRYGEPALVRDLLGGLDAGPLVKLLGDHANADNAAAVGKRATQLGEHGLHAVAAEAWASIALADDADPLERTVAAMRSVRLGERCDGLRSPLLMQVESPLSPRQREIAERAATGRTSRDIADELFVSTKTVDNHLQAIYRTLGISSRAELAQLLA